MTEKPTLKIGHLAISDHLILGITKDKVETGKETLKYSKLKTVMKVGWNQIDEGLCDDELDGAFILAPMAMDLFKSGQKISLVLLGHKNGSTIITNKAANIQSVQDFKSKIFIIPNQLSVHHMLLHKYLNENGLTTGPGKDVAIDVFAPSQIPQAIQFDEEGEIAGFIVAEPFGSQVVSENLGQEIVLSKQLWNNHPCCVLVFKDRVIEQHEDAVYELVEIIVQSGKFIDEHTTEAAEIGADFLGQTPDIVQRVLSKPVCRIRTDELFPVVDDLGIIQDYMTDEMQYMKSKIELEKLINTKFAKAAGAT